jgi:hypothetical protein
MCPLFFSELERRTHQTARDSVSDKAGQTRTDYCGSGGDLGSVDIQGDWCP